MLFFGCFSTTSDMKKVVFHEFHCRGQKSSFFELCKSLWELTLQRAKIMVSCTSKRKILATRSLSISRRAKMRNTLLHLTLGGLRGTRPESGRERVQLSHQRKSKAQKASCTSIVNNDKHYIQGHSARHKKKVVLQLKSRPPMGLRFSLLHQSHCAGRKEGFYIIQRFRLVNELVERGQATSWVKITGKMKKEKIMRKAL